MAESVLVSNPNNENILIARANLLIVMNQAEIAIPDMEAYCKTESGSENIAALLTLADLYRITGDMDKAEQKIAQAAILDADNVSVVHSRLLLLIKQKKYDEISQEVNLYLSAKARDVQFVLNAATILFTIDSPELRKEGIRLFEYAYEIVPDSKDTGFSLASALLSSGNTQRAEQIYKEMVAKFPNDIRVLNDYAWILQKNHQDYEQALELADKALKLAPNDLHILDTRGTILLKSGNKLEQAKEDFKKIVELSPSDSRQQAKALLNLGRVFVKLNDNIESKRCYQCAQEINQKIKVFSPAEISEIQENIK
jgi:tetratricopeptide (TPR) repeat protein